MTPHLLPGVRLHFDAVRDTHVLLAPERVLMLDQISHEILRRVDGVANDEEIVTDLAQTFDAPVDTVRGDVVAFLKSLQGQLLLGDRDG